MFWSLFIFREHSTREPASSRVTYFILRAYTKTGVSHSNNGKTRERFWKKCRWMERKDKVYRCWDDHGEICSHFPMKRSMYLVSLHVLCWGLHWSATSLLLFFFFTVTAVTACRNACRLQEPVVQTELFCTICSHWILWDLFFPQNIVKLTKHFW